ncbi:MAG TPA: putative quinol monooxygenase [Acetobacteraceae bacterium]|nr:putative quinol monooxygenase [Acetobacteraceae bacterium]
MSDGFALVVEFDVTPEHAEALLRHARENAAASVRDEPGCRRFDVLRPEADGPIALYEIYDDRAAFEAHLRTAHFAAFEAATKPLVRARAVRRFDLHENAKTAAPATG